MKPDWKNGEAHKTPSYLAAKEDLLKSFKKALNLEDYSIKVEDFYEESELTAEENCRQVNRIFVANPQWTIKQRLWNQGG